MGSKHDEKVNKAMFHELPYNGVNIVASHRQFNNSLSPIHIAKNYLDKLTSIYDLDLFNLNTNPNSDINPDHNIISNHIHSRYYSPDSFLKLTKLQIVYIITDSHSFIIMYVA